MHLAAESNSLATLTSLLEAKANAEAMDKDGFVIVCVLSNHVILFDDKNNLIPHLLVLCKSDHLNEYDLTVRECTTCTLRLVIALVQLSGCLCFNLAKCIFWCLTARYNEFEYLGAHLCIWQSYQIVRKH